MHVPQIIFLILVAVDPFLAFKHHGEPRAGKYNFISSLISAAVTVGLVYWGGFFGGR